MARAGADRRARGGAEAYYLALRKNDQTAGWMAALLALLADPAFARRIEALPGYTMAEPAGVLTPQEALPWFGPDGKEES